MAPERICDDHQGNTPEATHQKRRSREIHYLLHYWKFIFSSDLYDLGASYNVVSYSIYRKLGLREHKPMKYLLQFANGAFKRTRGGCDGMSWQIPIISGLYGDQHEWRGIRITGDPREAFSSNMWSFDQCDKRYGHFKSREWQGGLRCACM